MRSLAPSAAALLLAATASAQSLTVVGTHPALHARTAADPLIHVDFDRAVLPASVPPLAPSASVFGMQSGPAAGTWQLLNGGTRLAFTPAEPFFAGEVVQVGLSTAVQATDLQFLRPGGFTLRFQIATRPAPMTFEILDRLSSRTTPGVSSRLYGTLPVDLDDDGYVDLAAVNEDTADVRVFPSRGDGTGLFDPFLTPPTSTGQVPSPSEPADFDSDGQVDMATANPGGSTCTVLLGNGLGGFASNTGYLIGSSPHGLAALDADGDGDVDLAAACTGLDDVGLVLNDGTGAFGAPLRFDGGGSGEYAIAAGDLDEDGRLDLVVGCQFSQTVVVHLANGDATFSALPPAPAGGAVWMVVLGDVDGDGHLDVSCANGVSGTGSLLLGDGSGALTAPQVLSAGGHCVATDLGDLDGDGDLDWVLSSFGGGTYTIYESDALGNMTFSQALPGVSNPSCCGLIDFDRDGDLDVVPTDEIADVITLYENVDAGFERFCGGDGSGTPCPCGNEGVWGRGCGNSVVATGALLVARGTPSVAADTIELIAVGLPANAPALFFQGTARELGGLGTPLGDGLLCLAGTLVRLRAKTSQEGVARLGHGNPGDPSISVRGMLPAGGGTRTYQAWYRNAAAFCTGATYNLTNGVEIVWQP